MQPHAIQNSQPQFPIQELEQIEAVIQASLRLVATLEDRKTTLSAELERITQPQVAPVPPPTIKTIRRGLNIEASRVNTGITSTCISIFSIVFGLNFRIVATRWSGPSDATDVRANT